MIPAKPPEKLPFTYHLTIVADPEKGSRVLSVVATKMRGSDVIARRVVSSTERSEEALDDLNRVATRIFYFHQPEDFFPE